MWTVNIAVLYSICDGIFKMFIVERFFCALKEYRKGVDIFIGGALLKKLPILQNIGFSQECALMPSKVIKDIQQNAQVSLLSENICV